MVFGVHGYAYTPRGVGEPGVSHTQPRVPRPGDDGQPSRAARRGYISRPHRRVRPPGRVQKRHVGARAHAGVWLYTNQRSAAPAIRTGRVREQIGTQHAVGIAQPSQASKSGLLRHGRVRQLARSEAAQSAQAQRPTTAFYGRACELPLTPTEFEHQEVARGRRNPRFVRIHVAIATVLRRGVHRGESVSQNGSERGVARSASDFTKQKGPNTPHAESRLVSSWVSRRHWRERRGGHDGHQPNRESSVSTRDGTDLCGTILQDISRL